MKTVFVKDLNNNFNVGKIVCVGRNYAEHAKELGNEIPTKPVVFLKPTSSLIYSGGTIIYPFNSDDMHHEVELVLLIGTTIKNADANQSAEAIIGYGVGLDMTLRDVQSELKKKGHPWTIAKGFDTSAVISDFVSKENYALTLNEKISLSVNGVIKQNARLNTMIFNPVEIVSYISSLMTLEKGDLIYTGTPAGVSKVNKGDNLLAKINGVAELNCTVE